MASTIRTGPGTNRRLADQVSALGTAYPAAHLGADAQVGRRMPDIGPSVTGTAASAATRVYELLHQGGYVLLRFTDARDPHPEYGVAPAGRGPRISVVTARAAEEHPELGGVREVRVSPDGHVAWATRSADAGVRRTGRESALTARTARTTAP
ncbi:aromatic-ring hydroxylase C-terminal domain-containing protein [Streptomyces sp. NPDC054840]